jgi:hypothetical protein
VLKKSRWLLLKRNESLGDEQHFRLRDILRYNLKSVYLLKEAFQQRWDNSPAWAGKFLDEWSRQTREAAPSGFSCSLFLESSNDSIANFTCL